MSTRRIATRTLLVLLTAVLVASRSAAQALTMVEPGFAVGELASGVSPRDLERDHQGTHGLCSGYRPCFYLSDAGAGAIRRFDFVTVLSDFATGFSSPVGMAFGPGPVPYFGTFIYVADHTLGTVSRVSSTGAVTTFATIPSPWDCTFDPSGAYGPELFVSSAITGPIWKVSPFGVVQSWTGFGTTYMRFGPGGPWGTGLYAASHGSLGVGIATISPSGLPTLFTGGYDVPAGFDWAAGPGFEGDLFSADSGAGLLYRIKPSGERSVFATFRGVTAVIYDADSGGLRVCSSLGGCYFIVVAPTRALRSHWGALKARYR